MTTREAVTLRKRRLRRESQERAYREYVCAGPLVDASRPIIGGGDLDHPMLVQAEMNRRSARVQVETVALAVDFADRCLLVKAERFRMLWDVLALIAPLGQPYAPPVASTHPTVSTSTIPAL